MESVFYDYLMFSIIIHNAVVFFYCTSADTPMVLLGQWSWSSAAAGSKSAGASKLGGDWIGEWASHKLSIVGGYTFSNLLCFERHAALFDALLSQRSKLCLISFLFGQSQLATFDEFTR